MQACTQSRAKLGGLLLLLVPLGVHAQSVKTAQFSGSANIGTVTRQVIMRFTCALDRGKINNLAVEMDIPDAERFKNVFDVLPFEGPGAKSGKMHLVAAAASGDAQADLGSTGFFGNNGAPGTSFTFEAALMPGSKSGFQKLQALAANLSEGPGRLSWRIENPVKSQPPIDAAAVLTDQDAARVSAAVAPCLHK